MAVMGYKSQEWELAVDLNKSELKGTHVQSRVGTPARDLLHAPGRRNTRPTAKNQTSDECPNQTRLHSSQTHSTELNELCPNNAP